MTPGLAGAGHLDRRAVRAATRESQPSVSVAAPVPEQWAAWPMYVVEPSE